MEYVKRPGRCVWTDPSETLDERDGVESCHDDLAIHARSTVGLAIIGVLTGDFKLLRERRAFISEQLTFRHRH